MTSVSSSPTDPGTVDGPQPVFTESSRLQARLHDLVPGGAHTYARGSDQYPEHMTPIIERGRGARVWDVDGNAYVEYGMGLRSVTLGHAYEPVNAAVREVLDRGAELLAPQPARGDAAEDFLGLVSGADMVKFAKNGSDATTAALKLARAATGRDTVAVADQPFFSTDDWFIGTTADERRHPRRGPRGHRRLHLQRPRLAARALRRPPRPHRRGVPGGRDRARRPRARLPRGRARDVRRARARARLRRDDHRVPLVGGGAQAVYGVTPDLSTWGKAMGNGFPVSALAGRRELMELGGLRTDADRVFLLSTTHGPETAGLTAFRAVVEAYRREDPVADDGAARARRSPTACNEVVAAAGLGDFVDVVGHPACLVFRTRDAAGRPSQAMRTVFLQSCCAAASSASRSSSRRRTPTPTSSRPSTPSPGRCPPTSARSSSARTRCSTAVPSHRRCAPPPPPRRLR